MIGAGPASGRFMEAMSDRERLLMLGARSRSMEVVTRSKEQPMALSEPVLSGPGAGRTVTYGNGSSAELKLAGEQSSGDWAVVEWRVRAGDEPPFHTHTREDETLYVVEGTITAYVAASGSRSRPAPTRRSRRTCRTVSPCVASECDSSSPSSQRRGALLRPARRVRRRPGQVRPHRSRDSTGDATQLAGLLSLTWIIDCERCSA